MSDVTARIVRSAFRAGCSRVRAPSLRKWKISSTGLPARDSPAGEAGAGFKPALTSRAALTKDSAAVLRKMIRSSLSTATTPSPMESRVAASWSFSSASVRSAKERRTIASIKITFRNENISI